MPAGGMPSVVSSPSRKSSSCALAFELWMALNSSEASYRHQANEVQFCLFMTPRQYAGGCAANPGSIDG
jgi:hypothetical protein